MSAPQTVSPYPLARMTYRRMAPSSSKFQGKYVLTNRWPLTPFRVFTNSGDLLLRPTAPSPISQLSTRTLQWSRRDSATSGDGASGNQRYVYDSSIYVKMQGLKAILKNDVLDKKKK
jgi:hypothetical protein